MRIPVWSHDANPSVDPFLCRKKLGYCEDLILRGQLRALDSKDISKGCIALCRLDLRESVSHIDSLKRAAGWGFSSAWSVRQSGWAGPLVYQLNTSRPQAHG